MKFYDVYGTVPFVHNRHLSSALWNMMARVGTILVDLVSAGFKSEEQRYMR